MTETARSIELRAIAQAIADALPATAEEVVLRGSVSRGVADDVSDNEMLIVTRHQSSLEECFSLAGACGLTDLGTWGRLGDRRRQRRRGTHVGAAGKVGRNDCATTLAAHAQAAGGSGFDLDGQARGPRRADRGGSDGARSAQCRAGHDRTPGRTVALAPDGPNIVRARKWLGDAREILVRQQSRAKIL